MFRCTRSTLQYAKFICIYFVASQYVEVVQRWSICGFEGQEGGGEAAAYVNTPSKEVVSQCCVQQDAALLISSVENLPAYCLCLEILPKKLSYFPWNFLPSVLLSLPPLLFPSWPPVLIHLFAGASSSSPPFRRALRAHHSPFTPSSWPHLGN